MTRRKSKRGKSKKKQWWELTYTTNNTSSCITALQALMNDKTAKFKWTEHLSSKEVTFVYDMVSNAEMFKNFTPTAAQSRWMLAIVNKIKLVAQNS